MWSDSICGTGLKDVPIVGAPFVVTALPSGAMNWA